MAKFKKGDKVRVKDNPTWYGGAPVNRPDLTPGTIVTVDMCKPDLDGDISVSLDPEDGECSIYISEDSVEPCSADVHVGDRIRVYDKLSEVTREGVVTRIDDNRYVWIGKSADIAYSQNYTESVEVTVLERAFKWPDHEGFIRITGGKDAGTRGLVYGPNNGSFRIRLGEGVCLTEYNIRKTDPAFDFKYVEG